MSTLAGKVALVTGAGRGIGRAIALAYAAAGAQVAVSARSADELADVVRTIEAGGGVARQFVADLALKSDAYRLADDVAASLGPIEILVNNAGVGSSQDPRPVVDFDDDFWDLTLAVNLTAPYVLSKAVLPAMRAAQWGRIVTIASINGRVGSLHGAAYAASKHGVLGFVRSLAGEVAQDGITVNAICPGPVRTVLNDRRIEYDARRLGRDLAAHEQSLTPIGGRLDPEDIAPMAVFLASDFARMITGQAYNVCGGLVMS